MAIGVNATHTDVKTLRILKAMLWERRREHLEMMATCIDVSVGEVVALIVLCRELSDREAPCPADYDRLRYRLLCGRFGQRPQELRVIGVSRNPFCTEILTDRARLKVGNTLIAKHVLVEWDGVAGYFDERSWETEVMVNDQLEILQLSTPNY